MQSIMHTCPSIPTLGQPVVQQLTHPLVQDKLKLTGAPEIWG
jgi:hypothetical protein